MNTKGESFDLLSNSLDLFFKERHGDQLENSHFDIGA